MASSAGVTPSPSTRAIYVFILAVMVGKMACEALCSVLSRSNSQTGDERLRWDTGTGVFRQDDKQDEKFNNQENHAKPDYSDVLRIILAAVAGGLGGSAARGAKPGRPVQGAGCQPHPVFVRYHPCGRARFLSAGADRNAGI